MTTVAKAHRDAVLASHFLLRYLPPEDLRRLAAEAQVLRYPRSTTIFQKGDPGSSLMAVIRGRVKVCTYSTDGRELVLNIIGQGGLFGEIAVLDGRPRTADAVTLEETDLLVLARGHLLPFLTGNPEVVSRLLAVLCQRLRQASEHLEDALLREAPSRIARGLLRLIETFGQAKPEGGIRLDIKLSQQQLGNLIGVSRESINRHLGDWARAGYLTMEEGRILIRDRALLERIAETEA